MTTSYFLNTVAGNVFHSKESPAIPTTYYVGLSSTNPATSVTEPSGGAYARVPIAGLNAPVNGAVSNGTMISFAESTADWGVMAYFVIYDSKTDGNLLMYGALPHSRTIETETVTSFKAGALTLSIANPS